MQPRWIARSLGRWTGLTHEADRNEGIAGHDNLDSTDSASDTARGTEMGLCSRVWRIQDRQEREEERGNGINTTGQVVK